MHTFYLPPQQWGAKAELDEGESRHLARVLRLHAGALVRLVDGQGREGTFRVLDAGRKCVKLERVSETTHARPSSGLTLAVGWGKEVRRGWILEKCTEFGAEGLWFWQAERSQFPVPGSVSASWTASLIAGAKQCGSVWLPQLRTLPGGVAELAACAKEFDSLHVLVENSLPDAGMLDQGRLALPGRTLCVIGPEGGITEKELKTLTSSGFEPLSLGTGTLRWETAAMLALGLHWWGGSENRRSSVR